MSNQDTILAFLKVSKDAQIQILGELKRGITILILDRSYFEQITIEDVIVTPGSAFITRGTRTIGYCGSNRRADYLEPLVVYDLLKFPMIEISRALIQQVEFIKFQKM